MRLESPRASVVETDHSPECSDDSAINSSYWISGEQDREPPDTARFQRDRQVQDAALTTTLLIERAERRHEPLFLLSKDCAKCYDRITRWVMDYIYQSLGAPDLFRRMLLEFLAAGRIDV